MKSFIFYGCRLKLTNAHKLVSRPPQPEYFVRADTVDGDESTALSTAKPLTGETVLNTVPCFEPYNMNR